MKTNDKRPSFLDFFTKNSHEYFNDLMMYQRNIDVAYQEAVRIRSEQTKALCVELETDGSPVQKYADAVYDVTEIEFRLLYTQGFVDCVALLHALGVLA